MRMASLDTNIPQITFSVLPMWGAEHGRMLRSERDRWGGMRQFGQSLMSLRREWQEGHSCHFRLISEGGC